MGFNYLQFYDKILSTVATWSENDQKQLIEWWNLCALNSLSCKRTLIAAHSLGEFYHESVGLLLHHPSWVRQGLDQRLL